MVELNSVVSTLIKSMDETLKLCNLSVVYPDGVKKDEPPVKIDGEKKIITFTSADSAVKFEMTKDRCYLFCANEKASKAEDSDYDKQFESLFELESESLDVKDIKSLANEANYSILEYFGKNKKTSKVKKARAKKNNKNSTISYEPENLAYRIANIYPDLKKILEENTDKYEMTLSEEFFNEHANEYIMASIKSKDKQKIKKIFNVFNMFYEEGPKDTQSLIAVSILGMNFIDDQNLLESVSEYMEKDLKSAVVNVVKYLNTMSGKKTIKTLENPKPYVSKRFSFKKK